MNNNIKKTINNFMVCLPIIITALVITACGTKGGGGSSSKSNSNNSNNPSTGSDSSGLQLIATGSGFSLIVKSDGKLMAFGENAVGQLGLGDTVNKTIPTLVTDGVKAVAAGQRHTLVLKNDGTLFATGSNHNGQLGLGIAARDTFSPDSVNTLTEVPGFSKNVIAIAAGSNYTLVLKSNHNLLAFGANMSGQLGLDLDIVLGHSINSPGALVNLDGNVKAIAAGDAHSLVLTNDGALYVFGGNDFGQLGKASTTNNDKPILMPGLESNIKLIAAGYNQTFAVKATDGSLWVAGANENGQLGIDKTAFAMVNPAKLVPNITDIKAIAAGTDHTLILKNNGTVWAMGKNADGQLGLPSTTVNTSTAMQVTAINKKVVAIAASSDHSLAKDVDGNIWVFGKNTELGTETTITTPTIINIP